MEGQSWDIVKNLDLSTVKEKFLSRKGFFWKLGNKADKIEEQYRQFLFLIANNSGKTVVPWSQDLDDFWHEHILDTQKYKKDCEFLFGEFIHHNPHLPKGTTAHDAATAETRQMYRESFQRKKKTDKETVSGVAVGPDFEPVFCSACVVVVPMPASCGVSHHSSDHSSPSSCGSDSSPSCSASSCGGSSCGSSCSSCGSGCGGGD